jgi:hypothetical protein
MEGMKMDNSKMSGMDMSQPKDAMKKDSMEGMDLFSEYNYDYLKSPKKTTMTKMFQKKYCLILRET